MIKGDGFLLNFISEIEDIRFLKVRHTSVEKFANGLMRIHQNYNLIYQNCPINKNHRYSSLPNIYKLARNTLLDHYFDKRTSNFCCYCGKNEPERLDHFHPTSSVPQYSLARFNLIRSCCRCNEKKLNRRPISKLNLKHPYLHSTYNLLEILFDVKSSRIFLNDEGLVIFDVNVNPNKKLSRNDQLDIEKVLRLLGIRESVGSRVSIELTNICVDWKRLYKGSEMKRKKYFKELAKIERSKKHYTEYFCYNILSSIEVIRKIDNLIP